MTSIQDGALRWFLPSQGSPSLLGRSEVLVARAGCRSEKKELYEGGEESIGRAS